MLRLHLTIEHGALDFSDGISRFIRKTPQKIRAQIREKMSEPKHGRLYRRSSGKGFQRFHRASAKGEPPATDTGAYSRSLQIIYPNSLEAAIETNLKYPAILEKSRPMWLPVIDELLPELERDLATELMK